MGFWKGYLFRMETSKIILLPEGENEYKLDIQEIGESIDRVPEERWMGSKARRQSGP